MENENINDKFNKLNQAKPKDLNINKSKEESNTKISSKMSKNNKTLLPILIVGLILLLGLNAYQWFTQTKLKKDFQKQTIEIAEINEVNAQLDKDYETAIESLEEMRGDNMELNELIENQKTELADQKKKIKGLIWSKRQLKKAREEIKQITVLKDQYIDEVNVLKEKIGTLENDNASLRDKNENLSSNLASELEAKTSIIAAKDVLNKENKVLSSQVDMANAIKINFMEVKGYKEYDNGKLKKKKRAKNIHILRTCFTTETNMVTPAGPKTFQIKIIDPSGTTIWNTAAGSGELVNKLTDKNVKYTVGGTIEYNQNDTNACIDYRPSNPLSKGVYQVEMFNNGFLVGKGDFKLK